MIDLKNIKKTDKICLIVYGNIASGKSSFAKELLKLLPGFVYACIDQVRIDVYLENHLLRSIEREVKVGKIFKKLILDNNLIVYETVAVSQLFKNVILDLKRDHQLIYIHIDCPVAVCLRRFHQRNRDGYFSITPPFVDKMSIEDFLYKVAKELRGMKEDIVLKSDKLSIEDMIKVFSTNLKFNI
jgi:hypothetical protein